MVRPYQTAVTIERAAKWLGCYDRCHQNITSVVLLLVKEQIENTCHGVIRALNLLKCDFTGPCRQLCVHFKREKNKQRAIKMHRSRKNGGKGTCLKIKKVMYSINGARPTCS